MNNPEAQKWVLIAGACLASGVLLGMIGYLAIPDMNFKLVFMSVAVFDLAVATVFMGKAYRAK
jgi:hypothetical protein